YSKLYKNDSLYNIASYSTGMFNTFYGPISTASPIRPAYEAPMEAYNIYGALNIQDFTFSFFRNYARIPTAFGNNTSNAIYNKDVYMKQDITVANFSYRKTFNKITSITSMMTSEYNLNPFSSYRNLYTFMEKGYKYSTCTMRRMEEQLDYKSSDHFNFSAGIAIENYNAIPQSGDLNEPVNRRDHIHASYLGTSAYYRPEGLAAQFYFIKYYNVGSYLQTQFSPSDKLHFTIGARYDYNSRYGNTFNPRLGVVYKPSDNTTIKALYGSAYRAPSPSDAYSHYGSFYTTDSGRTYNSYFLHLPNPGLKPIKSYNGEVSVKQNITDNFILNIDGYYTYIKGLLQFSDDNLTTKLYNNVFNGIPVDYIEVFTNNNRQKTYGGTIRLDWKYSIGNVNLSTFASLSYVNGLFEKGLNENEETEKDTELDFISPFMYRIGIEMKAGKFSCSPRLLLMGRQNIAGISDTTGSIIQRQTIPGYALLNISARYALNKRFSAFINIHNALNQRYKSVGFNMDLTKPVTDIFYGQREDPIRFMGGLSLTL
ncbi:MAG TPA: TonB-dependent receptor, partial [Chitinophagaceae bacterium]|nr:TonB-dependent receptor [Chitinophagaceae bacterium]